MTHELFDCTCGYDAPVRCCCGAWDIPEYAYKRGLGEAAALREENDRLRTIIENLRKELYGSEGE